MDIPDYFDRDEQRDVVQSFNDSKPQSVQKGRGRPKKAGGNGRRQQPERAKTDADLFVDETNPHHTLDRMRKVLGGHPNVFRRGGKLVSICQGESGTSSIVELTSEALVVLIHEVSRPFGRVISWGEVVEKNRSFPSRLCKMFIDAKNFDGIKKLVGISSAPLIFPEGEIIHQNGYNARSGVFLENQIENMLTPIKSVQEAKAVLQIIREHIKSFPFADSPVVIDDNGNYRVDTSLPPRADESAALAGLFSVVARQSLDIAPGLMLAAPPTSGSGAGKGLLAHIINIIASGRTFQPITAGAKGDMAETEKRVVGDLMSGSPVIFLDNVNGVSLQSDLFASLLTEFPIKLRPLGSSNLVSVEAKPSLFVTGNGVSPSEDLARRFLCVNIDPRTNDAERRKFNGDIKGDTLTKRVELLGSVLSIIQWGLKHNTVKAQPFGAYDQWKRMVSDTLVALGCCDMADRVAEMKSNDPHRLRKIAVFKIWWEHHGDTPMKLSDLHDHVKRAISPNEHSRQYLVGTFMRNYENVRVGAFHMAYADTMDDAKRYRLEMVEKHYDDPAPVTEMLL